VLFKTKSGDDAQAQIEAFDDTWIWSHQSEAEYGELVQGGAPTKVANAIEAIRKLLGDNDLLTLVMITNRLVELHRVLRTNGSLYLHCDSTAGHYLKSSPRLGLRGNPLRERDHLEALKRAER
jgi:hypothetical protein